MAEPVERRPVQRSRRTEDRGEPPARLEVGVAGSCVGAQLPTVCRALAEALDQALYQSRCVIHGSSPPVCIGPKAGDLAAADVAVDPGRSDEPVEPAHQALRADGRRPGRQSSASNVAATAAGWCRRKWGGRGVGWASHSRLRCQRQCFLLTPPWTVELGLSWESAAGRLGTAGLGMPYSCAGRSRCRGPAPRTWARTSTRRCRVGSRRAVRRRTRGPLDDAAPFRAS